MAGCTPSTRQGPQSKAANQPEPAAEVQPPVESKTQVQQQQQPSPQKPTYTLTLKFSPQDATKYRVIVDADRSVQWEGTAPERPSAFKGGHTGNHIETTFTQKIRTVDEKGDAIADITIEALKYLGKVRDNILIDFDSTRQTDQNEPLAKLIGKTYTVELSPSAQVIRVVDVNQAQSAVNGASAAHRTASQLLSTEVIQERHTIPALEGTKEKRLSIGDSWSNIKTFSFGMMGSRTHERVYTLKDVAQSDNRQVAVVEMNAIPSAEMAKQLHKEEGTGFFTKMFDNIETYTGRLKLDLAAGKVEEYLEQLKTEWVAAEPPTDSNDRGPAALRMTATRLYHIERIP
jgi:hypothetical protein